MKKELELAKKEARSFSGLIPPNNAVFIGKEEKANDTINYYKDFAGNYYYDTEKGRKFEEDMLERSNRRKEEKRKLKIRGKTA